MLPSAFLGIYLFIIIAATAVINTPLEIGNYDTGNTQIITGKIPIPDHNNIFKQRIYRHYAEFRCTVH